MSTKQCSWFTEEPRYEHCTDFAVAGSSRCEKHKINKKKRKSDLETEAKNAFRKQKGNKCAICGEPAYEVDHIEELDSFPVDERWKANFPSNLQLLCYNHHLKKTNDYKRSKIVLHDANDFSTSARNRKKMRQRKRGFYY